MKGAIQRLETIDDFATLLERAKLGMDAHDMADALWLAQFIQPIAQTDDTDQRASEEDNSTPTVIERVVDTTQDTAIPIASPAPANQSSGSTSGDAPPEGIPIQIPAAPALRSRRDLAKALRPLMRKLPSRIAQVFDAEATTEQIAEQGLWSAVMVPAPERWFDLEIVIEQSRSTPIWQDTLAELKLLAEQQGAFRRVGTWQVQFQDSHPSLHPKWRYTDSYRRSCHHKTLIDPAGRRLIWLVTDCTSALWRQPEIYRWLGDWGKHSPVAIVQLLPGRLWQRTALGDGVPVQLSAFAPGVPNQQLKATEVLPFSEVASHELLQQLPLQKFQQVPIATVPVVSLEAYPLQQWAKVIAGNGDEYTPGFVFNQGTLQSRQRRKQTAVNQPSLSHKERVQRFCKVASPLAVKLAGLMAAAPVSPPIIQLIQQTLLPESQQVHVAEVYMSGLLKSLTSTGANLPPHQIQYDFLSNEVRDCLTDITPITKTEAVLDAVSRYISERLGLQAKTYEALLLLNLEGRPTAEQVVVPFAQIAKRALRRLGGDYAVLAAHIDSPDRPRPTPNPAAPRSPFPPLQTFEFEYPLISFEAVAEAETSLDDEFDLDLRTFEYQTISVDEAGQIIEQIRGTAPYFTELLTAQTPSTSKRAKVFVSYSHQDEVLRDELAKHLALLERQGVLEIWHDRLIEPGEEEVSQISDYLNQADLILLLVSADFIASSYAYSVEMHQALERHEAGEANVIPIILRSVDWLGTPFGKLQALPRDGKPVITWEDRDEAFMNIVRGIRRAAERVQRAQEAIDFEVPLDMVAIPNGTFLMGSPEDEIGHSSSESPQHEVTVPAFFMGKYPVTQAQWRAVAELDAVEQELDLDPARYKGDDHPVERVSWHDAMEFCARLSRLTRRDYRLPTEAEWEYACRAETATPFAFGETLTGELANYATSRTFAAEPKALETKAQQRRGTTPVGTFPPNAFGLYDMHGHVWEWCMDHWHKNYEGNPPTNGSAWLFSDEGEERDLARVLRGGSWYHAPRLCRSACRNYYNPDERHSYNGFRVVCSAASGSS
ncbi:MAG: SUMF1/EgtB/PvdO family nonheme iron enzyme [Leptolyngbya sp. SIO1E4]|nr:SUMF1/EgtB/PvdO family nonheme iron enzyme [Leptolyngbya sp. SIO1E4]